LPAVWYNYTLLVLKPVHSQRQRRIDMDSCTIRRVEQLHDLLEK